MDEFAQVRQRFLQDSPPRRLGAIAANLSRIRGCLNLQRDAQAALSMIGESRRFIEWTIADLDSTTRAALTQLDADLTSWADFWSANWDSPQRRQDIAREAGAWCDRALELTGLLAPTGDQQKSTAPRTRTE